MVPVTGKKPKYFLMYQAVARNGAAPVETGSVPEKSVNFPPGLLHDDPEGGDVPNSDDRVQPDLAGALGDEHMRPEIAEAPVSFYR